MGVRRGTIAAVLVVCGSLAAACTPAPDAPLLAGMPTPQRTAVLTPDDEDDENQGGRRKKKYYN